MLIAWCNQTCVQLDRFATNERQHASGALNDVVDDLESQFEFFAIEFVACHVTVETPQLGNEEGVEKVKDGVKLRLRRNVPRDVQVVQ